LKLCFDIRFRDKRLKTAQEAAEAMRDIAYKMQVPELLVTSYRCLGLLFKEKKDYSTGIHCFKMILLYAWVFKNKKWELESNEHLAIMYYYQGFLDKSSFYCERTASGIFEGDHSSQKKIGLMLYKRMQK
jgi:hypothetical protein